MQRTIIRFTC